MGVEQRHSGSLQLKQLLCCASSSASTASSPSSTSSTFATTCNKLPPSLAGMGGIGSFVVAFVLLVEHVGRKFTTLVGIAIEIPFALGEAFLGLEAFFIRDWQALQVAAYLPILGLLGLWWLVPESPRWLIGSGNFEQAKIEAQRVANGNGRDLPDHLLKSASISQNMVVEEHTTTTSVLDLFRPRKMLL